MSTVVNKLGALSLLAVVACNSGDDGKSSATDSIGSLDGDSGTLSGDGDGDLDEAGSGDGDGDGDGDGGTVSGDGDGDTMSGDGDGGIKFDVGGGIVGGGGSCDAIEITGEPVPPNIMLALDKSCSMGWCPGSSTGNCGWNALTSSITTLANNYGNQARLGARFFPFAISGNSNSCPGGGVDLAIADNNGMAVIDLINAQSPGGGTPTAPAVHVSLAALRNEAVGDRVLIIVSDGAADTNNSCAGGNVQTELANALADDAITTYVIGLGSSVSPAQLNAWAAGGGTGAFIPASDTQTLFDALDMILGDVISCTVTLDPPPDFPALVEVEVNGITYGPPLSGAGDCGDGFYYTTPAMDEIELCGAACDDLLVQGLADITYRCAAG